MKPQPGNYLIQCFFPGADKPSYFPQTSTLQQALRMIVACMTHSYNRIEVTHELQLGSTFFSFYRGEDKKWYMEE